MSHAIIPIGGGQFLIYDSVHEIIFPDGSLLSEYFKTANHTKALHDALGITAANHAASHTDGSDDIRDATDSLKGLATATQITKLDTIEENADVTDAANIAAAIVGAVAKGTPIDADTFALIDSADSNTLKEVTGTALKAYLKTYNDTLYASVLGADDNYVTDAEKAALHSAGSDDTITVANEGSDSTCFVGFFIGQTGDLGPKTAVSLAFDPTTGTLASTNFIGSVANTPAGNIAATNVQGAINELDTEKAPLASPAFTGQIQRSASNGFVAHAGGGQTDAAIMSADINEISVCATTGDSVKLTNGNSGKKIIVINHGVAAMDLFPAVGDYINEQAINTATNIAVNKTAICYCWTADRWEVVEVGR